MTEALLRSIRRWLITIAFLLALLLVQQNGWPNGPEVIPSYVGAGVAFVAALWLWHSFRGETGTAAAETASTGEN